MRTVLGTFRHLTRMRVSNVFLVDGGPGDRFLVDTGHAAERPLLLWELRRLGLGPRDLTGVLLTHRHSDHAGNAAFLQRHGVRVYAHRADAEVLAERRPRTPLTRGEGSRFAGVLASVENLFPARLVPDVALEAGDAVAGLEVHWMPGHTEGSVFFRHDATASLFSGDTLLAAKPPLTLETGLALPYPTFTLSMTQAYASLRAFHAAGHAYENLLAGHGPPILGGARDRVMALPELRER